MQTKLLGFSLLSLVFTTLIYAAPVVKLTTSPVPAANVNQGTSNVLVYAVKMKVTAAAVTINSVQYTLSGTHDANDLTNTYVYFNTTPTLTGASYLGGVSAAFAAPHAYSINVYKPMAAGDSGYYLITVNIASNATNNKTISINGSSNPVTFGYSTSVSLTSTQTNGGIQTIKAANIKLATSPVPAANINQGTSNVLIYAVKMKVTTESVTVSSIQYTLSGTHDADDLTNTYVYFNTTPSLTGASYLGGVSAAFAAPHAYNINVYKPMAAGDSGYYLITINVSNSATNNHTISINGSANPVSFGFVTAPIVTGTQANGSVQTIKAANVKLASSPVAAANINQGTSNVLVYAVKMKVTTEPLVVSSIQYTLSGTHDANDLTNTYVYFNTTPTLSGASYLGGVSAAFAAPHAYSINIYKPMAAGDSGYYLITVNVASSATDSKTITVKGNTTLVSFGFTTAPIVTGTQANGSVQTIKAANIKITSAAIASADINQGTSNVLVYAVKMKVTTEPVVVSNIQYTLSGTHDADDLINTYVYFNTTPSLTGASYLGGVSAAFAAPHAYSINVYKPMAAGDSGYYLITVNVAATATDGKTIKVTGSTTPAAFTFTTSPNITSTQTNSGIQTIQAADIMLSSTAVAAGNIAKGSNSNVIYIAKMNVATEPVIVSNIQYTLSGTHDADDLTNTYVYFNTTPSLTGASYLGGASAAFAAPHTYSINVYKPMTAGSNGYFIVTVNVAAAASTGKTVKLNGATDPVVFAYTTAPNNTNNQTNNAGTKTIAASFSLAPGNGELITGNEALITSGFAVQLAQNPVINKVRLIISTNKETKASIEVFAADGKAVLLRSLLLQAGTSTVTVDVAQLPVGVYNLVITATDGSRQTMRFVK